MPIQAIAAFYVMYRSVGIACLAGMVFMAMEALPLQGKNINLPTLEFVIILTVDWFSNYKILYK